MIRLQEARRKDRELLYNINQKYLDIIENRLKETLSEEEFNIFNNTLIKIYDELIPEIPLDE